MVTDFAPSTLVARLVGVDEFALGSTLAFPGERIWSVLAGLRPSAIIWRTIISWGIAFTRAWVEMRAGGCDCRDAFGGLLARCVATSGALGENDSRFEILWLSGIAGHVRDVLGGGGLRETGGWAFMRSSACAC